MSSIEWPSDPVKDVASEIAVLRGIDGGHLSSTVNEFWHQLALDCGVSPTEELQKLAADVVNALGLEFDDDYVDSDSSQPSLAAYEGVLAVLQAAEKESLRIDGEGPEPDEDDEENALDLRNINADVPPTPWTVRETLLRINEGSLILNPEWQRGFVWKLQKQRRLIESMLLGLPIPSFLFFEDSKTGQVFVIDGRQRLETISRFMSPKEEKGAPKIRFKTFNSKTPGWGDEQPLNDVAGKFFANFPEPFKKKLERAPLVTFTFKDIPPEQLYQIFKRYNTGAVALNAAEIRNAVYQASDLHVMMFRLGGEHRDSRKYRDATERQVGEDLRQTMPKGKLERYGAYDFIGRYFAFNYQRTGSVAAATNVFMQRFGKSAADVESLRQEFIRSFNKTIDWYTYPLVEPKVDGSFHALLGTIQLVSTTRALARIDEGKVAEDEIKARVHGDWPAFAASVLQEKQNSTLFWNSQERWINHLLGS
jgi:hypothetical protein